MIVLRAWTAAVSPASSKPPVGPNGTTLAQQLDLIRETPNKMIDIQLLVRYQGEKMPETVRRAVDTGTFARRTVNGLRRFWRAAMADRWSTLEAMLSADLDVRARYMAAHGVGELLASLHWCSSRRPSPITSAYFSVPTW